MTPIPAESAPRDTRVLLALLVAKLAIHLPVLTRYGVHRDELYFLSCGARPAAGYPDLGPLIAWVCNVAESVTPDSLFGVRLVALAAGIASLWLTVRLVRAFGGGEFAALLGGLAVMLAPAFLRMSNQLSQPSLEPMFWTGAVLVLVRLLQHGPGPRWLVFGAIVGLGFLNKSTIAVFGVGAGLGLVMSSARHHLATRWPWLGALTALAVASPNLIWQVANDWPTLAFAAQLREAIAERVSPVEFLFGQLLYVGFVATPIWIVGLGWLGGALRGRYRALAVIYVFVGVFFVATNGKIYYLSPIYPTLLAAGGVGWARLLRSTRARAIAITVLVTMSVPTLPLGVPWLPIERVDGYAATLTGGMLDDVHELTGDLHDMLGWPEHASAVADVWRELSPADRAHGALYGGNYGEAGCLERFWPDLERPAVFSNHLSWHWFGPPPDSPEVVIALAWSRRALDLWFADVREIARSPGLPQAGERDIPIWICREPRAPLGTLWPARAYF